MNNAQDSLEKHKNHRNALFKKKKKRRRSSFQHYSNQYLETYSQLSVEEYLGVVVKVIEEEPLVAGPNKILT